MKKSNLIKIGFLLLLCILFGCEKEEIPIEKHVSGDITEGIVELKSDYRYQVFYKFSTNSSVSKNLKTIWDLAFETAPNGYHIKLNSSKAMQAYNTKKTNLNAVTTAPSSGWTWDKPNGFIDSTAIGEWGTWYADSVITKNEVYVLDLGYDYNGSKLGYKKIIFRGLNKNKYEIEYANLDGSASNVFVVEKAELYNFTFFSFNNNGEVVMVEPPKTDWDLQFTQYSHIFYDNQQPLFYLVTGVLHNHHSTLTFRDTTTGFEKFDFDDALSVTYSKDLNTIGYDWKSWNYTSGQYSLKPEINYVVKTQDNIYYKMHFIDFYDSSGEKGTPNFEFQKL